MASIFKRKNKNGNTYYIQYYFNGKRYRDKVGKNYEAAQMRLGEIVRKIETGQFSFYSDTLLEDLIVHFKKSMLADGIGEETLRRRQSILKKFLLYCTDRGAKRVNQIDYPLLEEYVTYRIIEDKLAPNTSNQETGLIK